jgi:uncharacterized protein (DUF58 family)
MRGMKKSSRLFSTMSAETVFFLVLFLTITLAGFNSGNNLLYLVAGIMLAGIVVSAAAGYLNLFRIRVQRRLPAYAFANQPFKMTVEIANQKKRANSYALSVAGGKQEEWEIFLPLVRKGEKASREIALSFNRRGRYSFDSILVSSRFPWGLFKLKRIRHSPLQLIVYPPVYEINKVINGSSRIRDEFPQFSKGQGSGLYGVREYRHGEDISNISWKLSAKLDKLIVREREAEEKRRVCVVFDNVLEGRSEADLDTFERTVSAAASLVWYLCRNGYMVKLITRDKVIPYGVGPVQMHKMMIALALVQPLRPEDDGLVLDRKIFEGGTGVLIHSGTAPSSFEQANRDFAVILTEKAGTGEP